MWSELTPGPFSNLRGVVFAILLGSLTGCGPASGPPSVPPGSVRLGGTLVVDAPRLRSFDPLEATDVNSSSIAGEVFEGLVGYSHEDYHRIHPVLANGWEVSEDGRSWTFHLRPGVRFHDDPSFPDGRGRTLTADDFRYSLLRGLQKGSETVASSLRLLVSGAEEYASGGVSEVTGLEVLDERTLRFTLLEPSNAFLHALASVAGWVIPPEAVERYGAGFGRHPVGTGPFRIASWTDEALVLVRNEHYWRADDSGIRLPYLDRVVFRRPRGGYRDERAFSDLLGGSLHMVYFTGEIGWFDFRSLADFMDRRGIRSVSIPKWNTIYYGWNMARDNVWTRNRELRRAIAHTVKRPEPGELLEPARGLLPPGLPGCGRDFHPPLQRSGDGKILLQEIGFPEGRGLPILKIGAMGESGILSNAILGPLRDLGLRTEIHSAPWKQHWEAVERGDYEFFRGGWIADYPDAENFFSLFYSKSPVNQTRYSNPAFDLVFERLRRLPAASPDRAGPCSRLEEILQEDVPAIFMYHEKSFYLIHPTVRNIDPSINPMERKHYEYVWLDPGAAP